MNWSKPAARMRRRISRLLLLSLPFFLVSLHSEAAPSASLTVKIKQLNPGGAVQQVTCIPNAQCVLPVDIQIGASRETLKVGIDFVRGTVLARFQTPKGYLYAGNNPQADVRHPLYESIWHGATVAGKPSTANITLFLPLIRYPGVGMMLDAVQQPVAELEITMEPQP
jgi:hypothetical protein